MARFLGLGQRHLLRHLNDACLPRRSTTSLTVQGWGRLMCSTSASDPMAAPLPSHGKTPTSAQFSTKPQEPLRLSYLSQSIGRGAYDERAYRHVIGTDVTNIDVVSDGKVVSIQWDDGRVSRFHSMWLRYNCFCPQCRLDHTGQPNVHLDTVTTQSRLLSAHDDGEGCLVVRWKGDPDHTGIFPLPFLKYNCYSRESLQEKRDSVRMTFTTDNVIPRVDYHEVMESQSGVYKWVKQLNETGIAIVNDVPCVPDASMPVVRKIADCLQNSIYGETFEVKTAAQPINAAYASWELKLHMDLPMYEAPPGLQSLHCIKFDSGIKGGDSLFVDLFQVAETFRLQHPDDFDLLTRAPIQYETIHYKRGWPVHMCFQRPMFRMNPHGDLTGVVWHPHLIGPLQVEEELVEPVLDALGKFYGLINNFPHLFRHRLLPGEMVIFNNRRVLHGRRAFDSHHGERHLQGCYVDISEFKSCVHVLSNLEGDGKPPVRVGDNDWQ